MIDGGRREGFSTSSVHNFILDCLRGVVRSQRHLRFAKRLRQQHRRRLRQRPCHLLGQQCSNWGAGAGQIGPGTAVHLCGTFVEPAGATGIFTFRGSGSAGNPITLLFEPGAVLTAPYWGGQGSSGVIQATGLNNIVIDGGTDGQIIATANGSVLANRQDSGTGVSFANISDSEVKNLTVANLYVHTKNPDDPNHSGGSFAIYWYGGSNVKIDNNYFHDAGTGIQYGYPGSATNSNVTIGPNNVGYNTNHCYVVGDGNTNATLAGNNPIHDNKCHDFVNWDDSADSAHHDGIFPFTNAAGSTISGLQIYNNYIYGDPGVYSTAAIFVSGNTPAHTINSLQLFNNVLSASGSNSWANAFIDIEGAAGVLVANNIVVGNMLGSGVEFIDGNSSAALKNNIFTNLAQAIYFNQGSTAPLTESDYNDFFNNTAIAQIHGQPANATLSSWQSRSFDMHSQSGDPKLNGQSNPPYQPSDNSSVAFQNGTNLNNLGIAALGFDALGAQRPSSSTPWTIGSYMGSGSGGSVPKAPIGLTAQVQ